MTFPKIQSELVLAVCWIGAWGCRPAADPIHKALDAVGGQEALLELRAFSYESSGERFEPAQGLNPAHDDIRASAFTMSLVSDVEHDRLRLDWQREIFNPPRGKLAYTDVIDGHAGYQVGNDFYFNPPGATSDRALSSQRIGALKREYRLLNPHFYLRRLAADERSGTTRADGEIAGRRHHVIELMDEVLPVKLFVDAATGRVSKLETPQNDHLWGDVMAEVTYGDWRVVEGGRVSFPHRVELALDGKVLRVATRSNVVSNPELPAGVFDLPEKPRTAVDKRAEERGAVSAQYVTRWNAIGLPFGDQDQTVVAAGGVLGDPDVQYLTGGSHHSLAVKLGAGIVVVEPPLNEARSKAVLRALSDLWPGAPVTHVILTHHHFDHMGGIRTYAAAGVTIVTSELNSAYVEKALRSSHTLVPDELSRSSAPGWVIEAVPVDTEFHLTSAGRTIRARHVSSVHDEDMLVVYLPELRLIFESDIYVMPGGFPPHQPLPDPFSTWARELRDGLVKLDWDIEWIAGGHGGLAPFDDLGSHFEE